MGKWVIILLGLVLISAAVFYGYTVTSERNALKSELESTKTELALTQSRLVAEEQSHALTREELGSTKATLLSTQTDLASVREQYNTTKDTLASTQVELSSTRTDLTSLQISSSKIQDDLTSAQKQLTSARDTLSGLGITIAASKECSDVSLVDNPVASNPTWNQLLNFLSLDQTDSHVYIAGVYDCSQFSRDVHNNAEKAGIRTAEVQVKFNGEITGHALNAFLTTDYGLVYIDCTGGPDTFARVEKGRAYRSSEIYNVTGDNIRNDRWWDNLREYYYISSDTSGQVETSWIKIFW